MRAFSFHEIVDRNCGGNILLDNGDKEPTGARFEHMTNVNARNVGCQQPGPGVIVNKGNTVAETYTIVNAIFWGNATHGDLFVYCDQGCNALKVNVSFSLLQRECANCSFKVTFGDGILAPVDPLFADPARGDFHLKSTFGRWTVGGYVQDKLNSPALAKRLPNAPANQNPPRRQAQRARRLRQQRRGLIRQLAVSTECSRPGEGRHAGVAGMTSAQERQVRPAGHGRG